MINSHDKKENKTNDKNDENENTEDNYDLLKLYYQEPYKIGKTIVLQPTIGEIIEVGEVDFYKTLSVFTANTTMFRLLLWKQGIDWNKISDFNLFQMRIIEINEDMLKLILPQFHVIQEEYNNNVFNLLYDKENDVVIDENLYNKISGYLRTVFNYHPKVEKVKGKIAKQWVIDEEESKMKRIESSKEKKCASNLLPLISTYLNYPGTKYKKNELKDVGIFEFMDSIQRIQIIESTKALNRGVYSGMVSTKDISKENFDMFRAFDK